MKSIQSEIVTEIVINKSVFINYLIPVSSVEDANGKLDELRAKYNDANHHCFAYIIGNNQEVQKYSDDGEPSKTAGMPMLDVLKKHELTNIMNVSIRYFGGIKLGAGGLVRAYTKSCSTGILEAIFTSLKRVCDIKISVSFDLIGVVEKHIRDNYQLNNTTYDNLVHYRITLLEENYSKLEVEITDKTSGKGSIELIKEYDLYI